MNNVGPAEAQALLARGGADLVDVREPHEWQTGHLPGARLVPLGVLRADPRAAVPREPVIFVCARGGRSQSAARLATDLGLVEVYSLDGGTDGWAAAGLPLVHPEAPAAPARPEPHPPPAAAPSSPASEAPRSTPGSPAGAPPTATSEAAAEGHAGPPALDALIGANLRSLRTRRGLSLDATARLTGIGRSLLGQIELGTASASVAVVWKIARAFDVPFAVLLEAPGATSTAVLRRAGARRLVSADGRFSSRALWPAGEATGVEFYELWLAPHGSEEAEAHPPGTRENLVVSRGRLDLEVAGERHQLGPGDAIVFAADVPHRYDNPGSDECVVHLVMTYPERGAPP